MSLAKMFHVFALAMSSLKEKYIVFRNELQSPSVVYVVSCKTKDCAKKILIHKSLDWIFRNKQNLKIWRIDALGGNISSYRLFEYGKSCCAFVCIPDGVKLKILTIFKRPDVTLISIKQNKFKQLQIRVMSALNKPPDFTLIKPVQNIFENPCFL